MRGFCKLVVFAIGLAGLVSCRSSADALRVGEGSPSSERLQVYGDFVELFSKTNFKVLSDRTFPLDLSGIGKDAPCLRGIELEGTELSTDKMVHSLGPEVLRGHSIRIIGEQEESAILKQRDAGLAAHGADFPKDTSGMTKDPGVLALSEIAFDKSHHFAVLKYVFLCGSHCNSGAVLVLEKVGSRWSATDAIRRTCSIMVNSSKPRS